MGEIIRNGPIQLDDHIGRFPKYCNCQFVCFFFLLIYFPSFLSPLSTQSKNKEITSNRTRVVVIVIVVYRQLDVRLVPSAQSRRIMAAAESHACVSYSAKRMLGQKGCLGLLPIPSSCLIRCNIHKVPCRIKVLPHALATYQLSSSPDPSTIC